MDFIYGLKRVSRNARNRDRRTPHKMQMQVLRLRWSTLRSGWQSVICGSGWHTNGAPDRSAQTSGCALLLRLPSSRLTSVNDGGVDIWRPRPQV